MHALFRTSSDHVLISWLFLKLLAVIYFAAFASIGVQISGLAGPDGILPFKMLLENAYEHAGLSAYWQIPTIFWFNSSEAMLESTAIAGCILSLMLLLNIQPRFTLILLFALYLSLYHAGQLFMNFQWDYLLLEAGFLAIFLVRGPNFIVIFLFDWLLFRLRFLSGLSKIMSGDPVWREGCVTDNGNHIIDVHNMKIMEPIKLERDLNQIVGVVTNGLFADRGADRLFLGTSSGVEEILPRGS